MIILGLHFETHDSGAALLADGEIRAVVSEERFSRKKSDGSAPLRSIEAVLATAGMTARDVDLVAVSGSPPAEKRAEYAWVQRELRNRQGLFGFASFAVPHRFFKQIAKLSGRQSARKYHARLAEVVRYFQERGAEPAWNFVPHSMGHLASGYYTAPTDERWLVIDLEGQGGRSAGALAVGVDGRLEPWCALPWPHSIGRFYAFPVKLLGMKTSRHAGKVTGLAGRGDPGRLYSTIRSWIQVTREPFGLWVSPILDRLRAVYEFTDRIPAPFADVSPADFAAAFQKRFEEVCVEFVREAVRRSGIRRVILVGGCFANVRCNQRIAEECGAEQVYVHPGMGDVGLPLGCALHAAAARRPLRPRRLANVYLGPGETDSEIEHALANAHIPHLRTPHPARIAAQLVARGAVVGCFDGRMEYGPRALGNRSILASAGRVEINEILNQRLNRSDFMPFAPAVLAERVSDYLCAVPGTEYSAEFMTITYGVREAMRREGPATVHVDGTARPQVVHADRAPRLHAVLTEYERITGIGMMINTSFNLHEEPIVCTSADAVRSFQEGRLDYLVAGPFVAWQQGRARPADAGCEAVMVPAEAAASVAPAREFREAAGR